MDSTTNPTAGLTVTREDGYFCARQEAEMKTIAVVAAPTPAGYAQRAVFATTELGAIRRARQLEGQVIVVAWPAAGSRAPYWTVAVRVAS
jgi:hypothetical protein